MHSDAVIRAVIFDMDGVLSDSEPLINAAALAMFREKGLGVRPEDFIPFVGTGEDRYISGVAELYRFPLDLPAAKHRTYEIYLQLVDQQLRSFPGAVELVRQCREAGLKTAVASSADRVKIEANLRKIGLPLASWDAVISAEDVANKKPAPDLFLAAASRLSIPPEQCVVIEDAVNGVQAAKAAGMRCVAVGHTFPMDRLQAADLLRPSISSISVSDLTGPLFDRLVRQANSGEFNPVVQPPVIETPPPIPRSAARAGPWGFWETTGLATAIFAAFVAVQAAVSLVFAFNHGLSGRPIDIEALESGLLWGMATLAAAPVVIAMCWFFAWLRKAISVRDYLALRPVSGRILLRWCIALAAFVIVMDGVTFLLGRPIVPDVLIHTYRTAGFLPLLWLAVVVVAPISEELLFRGFMFKGFLSSRAGETGAIFLTALVWAAIHLQYDLFGVALIFIAGVMFGYARVKTGSVYTTIVMHGLMNLIATIETAIKAQ